MQVMWWIPSSSIALVSSLLSHHHLDNRVKGGRSVASGVVRSVASRVVRSVASRVVRSVASRVVRSPGSAHAKREKQAAGRRSWPDKHRGHAYVATAGGGRAALTRFTGRSAGRTTRAADSLRRGAPGLLPVALDGVRVANVRVVGVGAGLAEGAALAQQIPAAVELDLDLAQTFLIGLELVFVVAVGLFAVAELVLLGDQLLDPVGNRLVAHVTNPTPID